MHVEHHNRDMRSLDERIEELEHTIELMNKHIAIAKALAFAGVGIAVVAGLIAIIETVA